MQTNYETIRVQIQEGVAQVTIDHPPVNVLGIKMMNDIKSFLKQAATDTAIKVIVFDSANPGFFIAHVDMTLDVAALGELAKDAPEGLNPFQAFGELLRQQPQVTIVKLKGIARGGGAEFVAAADMCFAAIGKGALAQCEALMGIVPGGGATQYLGMKMSRSRTLEVVLGADLFDAETAAQYGWINRALPAAALDTFVDTLARNIAALPEGVIAAAKTAVGQQDLSAGFKREHDAWFSLVLQPAAGRLIAGGVQQGLQTYEGELALEKILRAM